MILQITAQMVCLPKSLINVGTWLFCKRNIKRCNAENKSEGLRSLLDCCSWRTFIELKHRTCRQYYSIFIGNSGKNWIRIHITKKAITRTVVMIFFLLSLSFKLNIIFTNIWSVGIDWIRRLSYQSNQFCCVKLFSNIRYNWSWIKIK